MLVRRSLLVRRLLLVRWLLLVRLLVRQASCKLFCPDPLAYRHLAQSAVEVGVATERCEVLCCGPPQLS